MWRTGARLLFASFGFAVFAGCGDSAPFPMEPVQGTVKYEDGSLIRADQIRIVFEPQKRERSENVAPGAAETYVDVDTGEFQDLTTWKFGDGVIAGHHKVSIIALSVDPRGMTTPTSAVPRMYHRPETTPIEVEVVQSGDNSFDLKVTKAPAR